VGWRNIIEKMHMTATLTKWYEEHGRHEIFAGGKQVDIGARQLNRLVLNEKIETMDVQHDLDRLGIAKNSGEEKKRARDSKMAVDAAHNEKMARLYREVVLKEQKPADNFVPLSTIAPANGNGHGNGNGNGSKPAVEKHEGELVSGD
jgi:hypothetical protein